MSSPITTSPLFIHKYQPIYLKDYEISQSLHDLLIGLVKMDKISILFIGKQSSGKTSFITTLIKEYFKDIPYQNNILYINNLKDQGITYYRSDVKTFCQTPSSIKGKKKIVVLDDIDYISEQSQQIFRSNIDKYRNNVHFIASCSNPQKVIEPLQSRLNIISVKHPNIEMMGKIYDNIVTRENIIVTEEAKQYLLKISSNVKILFNELETFKLLNETITLDLLKGLTSTINFVNFQTFTMYIKSKNLSEAVKMLLYIYDKGYSVLDILCSYYQYLKSSTILSENEKYDIVKYICKYISIFHTIHEDEIELVFFTNNILQILCK